MASVHGYDFSATRQLLERYVQSGQAAGISLQVTHRGETILATQVGMADREGQIPMSPDTIFRLFSMTKPVTAVLLLMLYEHGLVHLNDPVSAYLPGFARPQVWVSDHDTWSVRPASREVTLHDLLTMTSGIPYPADDGHPASRALTGVFAELAREPAGTVPRSLAAVAEKIAAVPLCFDPGSAWLYGLSLDIIGAVIEVVSGKTLGQFMKDALCDPLAMRDTAFFVPPGQMDRLAVLYTEADQSLVPSPKNPLLPFEPDRQPGIEFGGAGLYSTRSDYTRFARMLLAGGTLDGQHILSRRTIDLMRRNHLTPAQLATCSWETMRGYGYGLGVRSLLDPVPGSSLQKAGEFGWDGAAGTWFGIDPGEDLTIVYLVQRLPGSQARFIPRLLATLYAALN